MTATAVQVRLDNTDAIDTLHRHYQGQHQAQNVYVALDLETGALYADYDSVIGSGVPSEVHDGRVRRYTLGAGQYGREPVIPTPEGANQLLEQIKPLAQRVLDGASIEWDGNNMVGVLTADAQEAEEEIGNLVSSEEGPALGDGGTVEVWSIDTIGETWTAEEAGITAQTTDSELDDIEARLLAEFREGVDQPTAIIEGLDDYLRRMRDDLAAEEADEDED
jgi:hypothetical protein